MSFLNELKDNFKFFLILLGISSFLQFMFKQAFVFPSILPLNIPNGGVLEAVGNIAFYLYFITLIVVSAIMSTRYKALISITIILLISPLFNLIPHYNVLSLWYSLEIAIFVLGIASMSEGLFKSPLENILLIPTMFLVVIGLYASISLNVFHHALFLSYLIVYFISLLSFITYTIIQGKVKSIRSYISIAVGILSLIPFIFMENVISGNRYMEILMDMILPATLGINLYNPYHITLLVLALGLTAMGILISIIKGNLSAGVGYFIVISTVFLGINGYTLLLYMISPIVGFCLMNFEVIERKKRIIEIISLTRKG